MAEQSGEGKLPSEQVSTEALKEWVNNVVEAGQGNNQSLQRVNEGVQKFQKYQTEVYLPILSTYIKALRDASNDPAAFTRSLLGIAGMMFVAGYTEGKERQIEIDKLNKLFDKGTPENY